MIEFEMPQGWKSEDVARTFGAYIQGHLAFQNGENENGQLRHGPHPLNLAGQDRWQLDESNNYRLRVEGSKGILTCRYSQDEEKLPLLVALFRVMLPKDRFSRTAA